MTWNLFLEILIFCTEKTGYFSCLNKKWLQKEGCAMGNSLSPVLADIVMTDLLQKCGSKMRFLKKLIAKYVDDLLFIIPSDKIQIVYDILNSYDPNIKFTYEVMQNNKISYLDTEIIIHDEKIVTKWYMKPTSKGRILNFNSLHAFHMKINTAKGLIRRIFGLSDEIRQDFPNLKVTFTQIKI